VLRESVLRQLFWSAEVVVEAVAPTLKLPVVTGQVVVEAAVAAQLTE